MLSVKFVGNTLPCCAANSAPPRAPIAALKLNAITFSLLTGIVIADAASGSSRSARHARPVREVSSRCRSQAKTATTISATK